MALYFAYGSNMRSARLVARIGNARAVCVARASGFALRFDKPGRDGSGKANLVRRPGGRVWGVAWALPDEAWPRLDRFEPGYRRASLPLESLEPIAAGPDPGLQAAAYFYPSAPDATRIPPSAEYLEHLIEGALEHGLPDDYIREIRAAARAG